MNNTKKHQVFQHTWEPLLPFNDKNPSCYEENCYTCKHSEITKKLFEDGIKLYRPGSGTVACTKDGMLKNKNSCFKCKEWERGEKYINYRSLEPLSCCKSCLTCKFSGSTAYDFEEKVSFLRCSERDNRKVLSYNVCDKFEMRDMGYFTFLHTKHQRKKSLEALEKNSYEIE